MVFCWKIKTKCDLRRNTCKKDLEELFHMTPTQQPTSTGSQNGNLVNLHFIVHYKHMSARRYLAIAAIYMGKCGIGKNQTTAKRNIQ